MAVYREAKIQRSSGFILSAGYQYNVLFFARKISFYIFAVLFRRDGVMGN